MRSLLNMIVLLIAGVLLFFLMQMTLVYLKDKQSQVTIEEPEFYMSLLNRTESELLLNEKNELLKMLNEKEKQGSLKKISKEERKEIDEQIAVIKKKVVENERKLAINQKEKNEVLKKEKDNEAKNKEIYTQLIKKNDENNNLIMKLEDTEKKIEKINETMNTFFDSTKEQLTSIYSEDKKSIERINEAFSQGKQIELITSELSNITPVKEDKNSTQDNKALEKKYKTDIAKKDKEIAGLKKSIEEKSNAIVPSGSINISPSIKTLDTIIESNFKNNAEIFKQYNALKKTYKANGDHVEYMTSISELIAGIVAKDRQEIADRDTKNAKNATEIMKLLKTIDELKKK